MRAAVTRRISAFEGGRATRGLTRRHVPLIFESMLGTVRAHDPGQWSESSTYFDYDYEGAHAHARVQQHDDLRICRSLRSYQCGLQRGRWALFGVRRQS